MVAGLSAAAFQDLPGWHDDDPTDILNGLKSCARHVKAAKPYKTGQLGLRWTDFMPAVEALKTDRRSGAGAARSFFETHFIPFRIRPQTGGGFVTAYYEPELDVSATPDAQYRYPIHGRPDDLVALNDSNRPANLKQSYAYGRQTGSRIVEYADRRAIDNGFLDGLGLEIAWAKDRADLFFVHIQGSARLRFPDGNVRRITYAAKTGHPFTPIGQVLIDRGALRQQEVTMQTIRQWLSDNPQDMDALLWCTRSYIFFRRADVDNPDNGPVAAAKVPLVAGRSLAVDKVLHTFGTPIYVEAGDLTHLDGGPFRRLMLAQDTGSAIVGPARGDIFTGFGAAAGELAGTVKHPATFHMLVPNAAAERLQS
ncbi:MAG: murein transglycosylase A [Pseudomonadota bacterium]